MSVCATPDCDRPTANSQKHCPRCKSRRQRLSMSADMRQARIDRELLRPLDRLVRQRQKGRA